MTGRTFTCAAMIAIALPLAGAIAAPPPVSSPGPRIGHSLLYDQHQRRIVLLDGYSWLRAVSPSDPPHFTALSSWDGARWVTLAGTGPASRTMGRAVYDSARHTIVAYGGRVGRDEAPSSETWEWNQGSWRKAADASAGPNVHVEMAYDAARNRTIRFGGATRYGDAWRWPTDTWAWDGARWTTIATTGPTGRAAAAMVYDGTRREIVLFGGQGAAPAPGQAQPRFDDTWTWDGRAWRRKAVEGPPARAYHAMSFDARRGLVLLYGGNDGPHILEDLWAWDGIRWTEIRQTGPAPGPRRLHAMAFDPGRGRTVLYGGAGPRPGGGTRVHDDVWEWNGSAWQKMAGP
jgi:hypothetical protein